MERAVSWVIHKQTYEQIAAKIEPAARLSTKGKGLWKVVDWFVPKDMAVTLGLLQRYPRHWARLSRRLIVHECTHTTQCVWLGWLIPIAGWFFGRRVRAWCGLLPFAFLYLLVFLPLLLAYFRYRLELHADIVSWRWALANDGWAAGMVRLHASERADSVCGRPYIWAWPKPLGRRGYTRAADKVIAEHVKAG